MAGAEEDIDTPPPRHPWEPGYQPRNWRHTPRTIQPKVPKEHTGRFKPGDERINREGKPTGRRSRKTLVPNEMRKQIINGEDLAPLEFLRSVYMDETEKMEIRVDAAKAAAPYVHPKLSTVTLKDGTGAKGPVRVALRVQFVQQNGTVIEGCATQLAEPARIEKVINESK